MPKPVVNNRINYQNIHGRIIKHDSYLNQGVKLDDSPTFANLLLTGDATIEGNLYVEGNTFILETNVAEFKDNIILINNQETNAGVTLNQAGMEIDRGSLENYRIVYNESNARVEVGLISDLQPIVIRESVPLNNGIMTWNSTLKRIESNTSISLPITFTSTTASTSSSTGTVIINGGLGVKKDVYMDGKISLKGSSVSNSSTLYTNSTNNTLNITSVNDINITPTGKILIPFDKYMSFGNSNQNIIANSITSSLSINSNGDINLTPATNKKINVPNQIPITFSTQNEKIYTDSSNNMVIAGSEDIYLYPNNGSGTKRVFIPVNTPMVFGNSNQSIISNISSDLTLSASNNIILNPGASLDVKIPIDVGVRFGSGNQRIIANSSNELSIYSTGDMFLTPTSGSKIRIPVNIPITFATTNQSINGDTFGNIVISSNSLIKTTQLNIVNTLNSTNASTGSIYTNGGLGVRKDIISEGSIIAKSNNVNSLQIQNSTGSTTFLNANSQTGKITISSGDGTSSNPSLEINTTNNTNGQSLIQLVTNYDNTIGYLIGRGTSSYNSGRALTINLPTYLMYSNTGTRPKFSIMSNNCSTELFSIESETGNMYLKGQFNFANTEDSLSSTTGSLILNGGLGIVKNVYTTGKIIQTVNSTEAYKLQDTAGNTLFKNDSNSKLVTINEKIIVNIQDSNALSITDTIDTLFNINTTSKQLTSSLQHNITNTTNSTNASNGSVVIDGGLGVKKALNVYGNSSFSNGVNMLNTKITNVASPISAQDVANKAYVDLVGQYIASIKDSAHVATVSPITLNTDLVVGNTIDNYVLIEGDRVLVKDQTNAIENGIYNVTSSTPERSVDFSLNAHVSGVFVYIQSGSINKSLGFICNSLPGQDVVGVNELTFTQFAGISEIIARDGLTKTFNELDVNVDNYSIEIEPVTNSLRLKSAGIGTGLTGGSGLAIQTLSDQSHVTKLGTINTGTWQATTIAVNYGGTGKTTFSQGNILFGNGTTSINESSNLFYDALNTRLGLGTNAPANDFEIKSTNTITMFLNADALGSNSTAKPEIKLAYNGGLNASYIGMTRAYNQYANGIYNDALVISNDQTGGNSVIQLATNKIARFTVLSNGNIGINTTNPSAKLSINGTFNVNDISTFSATKPSISITEGSVIIAGGLSISCPTNSIGIGNGGALTVDGGVSIGKDLYVGGAINCTNAVSNTFSYITITATDEAINLTTGSFVTFGGITIQCPTYASSVTDGGSLLTPGGASIGGNLYVGDTINAESDMYIHNLYFTSSTSNNYIQSPNETRTTNSFLPINFTSYNNISNKKLTIADNSIILNDAYSMQIGGSLDTPAGYTLQYVTNNLNIRPNASNYSINIGTLGNYSDVVIYGNNSKIKWESSKSNVLLTNSSIEIKKYSSSGSILITSPDVNSQSFIQASGSNMILNLGEGSMGGQLITKLSNDIGDASITFTPSNISSSTLILTDNVYTTVNGPVAFNDRVEYAGNALHQSVINSGGNSMWVFLGALGPNGYCEIDFNNGTNLSSGNLCGLKFMASISNTTANVSHLHYGDIVSTSNDKPVCYLFTDYVTDYYIFVKLAAYSQTNINVTAQQNTKFVILNEGYNSEPNGTFSGYVNTWTTVYHTQHESTLKYNVGDLVVENTVMMNDNLPIVGYNNENTTQSRDIGILYKRYQQANDSSLGDIVSDTPQYIDTIPSQSTISSLNQLKLSNSASSVDNYYSGWWIKITSGTNINQVRKITNYNGAQRIATLDTAFTTQNPSTSSTVNLYKNVYLVNYYDETNDTFSLSYTDKKPVNGIVNNNGNANLRLGGLYSTSTIESINATTGSVRLLGGISINNTTDAESATSGGTITTAGGMGIRKKLFVGDNIGIGVNGFVPQEALHIRKTNATSRYEHDTNGYSYIDFVENGTTNRFGIFIDSSKNQMYLTNTGLSQTPQNANKALTLSSSGYIGINTTTNVNSPLAINTNNFISTNATNGYLGLVGGATNINNNSVAARIILHANNQVSSVSQGCLNLYAGNISTGNVSIFTGNDIERVNINNSGQVTITSTDIASGDSSGSLITNGGITIKSSANSTSNTTGGALTVKGGVSIEKDIYIGGNLYIDGSLSATGSISSPVITFYDERNCSVIEYFSNDLNVTSTLGTLRFGFTVSPSSDSENCEVEINVPERITNFTKRFDIISNCTGYTDDTNVIPIMNVISCGIVGTTRLLVKFQSVSTAIHYFQLICIYSTV